MIIPKKETNVIILHGLKTVNFIFSFGLIDDALVSSYTCCWAFELA